MRIFISYRRADSRAYAERIHDQLVLRFGKAQVFQDVDNQIPPGLDFRDFLTDRVALCDVFLVVIGRGWSSIADPKGSRRLDDPHDFVRIEIETALARNIPVIPVLVDGSTIPTKEELPESLQKLAYRQASHVRPNPDFHQDIERLLRGIDDAVTELRQRSASQVPRTERREDPTSDPSSLPPGPLTPSPTVPSATPNVITNSIGMKLALIPAGEFLMGSPDSDSDAYPPEMPQHPVRITQAFYLGVHEVTQGQYRAVTGQNPSHFKGSDELPVEQVSWNDAIAFCNKLSEREGLKPYYSLDGAVQPGGEGYRLPTEAEWEYACRAGSTTRFSFGDDAASVGEYAWYAGNSGSKTQPVGQKRPNAWGLYDMHGNVWEWCWDGYDESYYRQSPVADPGGPAQAAGRVDRGGSWRRSPRFCRSANRSRLAPRNRNSRLGFRVARALSSRWQR
jgi:formylglycine-generating enzyme required for sulfatase activity